MDRLPTYINGTSAASNVDSTAVIIDDTDPRLSFSPDWRFIPVCQPHRSSRLGLRLSNTGRVVLQ